MAEQDRTGRRSTGRGGATAPRAAATPRGATQRRPSASKPRAATSRRRATRPAASRAAGASPRRGTTRGSSTSKRPQARRGGGTRATAASRAPRKRRTSSVSRAIVVLVCAAILATIAWFATASMGGEDTDQPVEAPAQVESHMSDDAVSTALATASAATVSPYSWSNIQRDANGHLAYVVDGQKLSRLGIDVSEHNGDIDWEAVARAGVQFAYVRVGYRGTDAGNIVPDPNLRENLRDARAAGLKVGAYFYSSAKSADEAREEAEFTLKKLDGLTLDYPVAFDLEPSDITDGRISDATAEQLSEAAQAFCETITAGGYASVVYGNQYDLAEMDYQSLYRYGFWYAEYDVDAPTSTMNFALWQYTKKGTVDGIETSVDMDLDLTPAAAAAAAGTAGTTED